MFNFDFHLPTKIVFGVGKFQKTGSYLKGFGKSCFIVTSKSFTQNQQRKAVLDDLLAQLKKINVEYQIFSEIEPNPRTTTIDRAGALLKQFNPRFVLALGGGSVMDAAKCLALLAKNDGPIYDYAYPGPIAATKMKPFQNALPIICIPTVAATSSESDTFAVVTDLEKSRKLTVFGEPLFPSLSIIDPELTYSVGPQQTVDGAFDIITHVTESYWSTKQNTFTQDRLTEAIVKTVITALPEALANPQSETARSNLSWCSTLALSGFLAGRDGGWPIHAIEHGLSAYTDVAHGRGLAMLLPAILQFDNQVIAEKISYFNKVIFNTSSLDDGLINYMKKYHAYTKFSEIYSPAKMAETPALLKAIADHALEIKGIWRQGEEPYLENCRPIYKSDIIAILQSCF